MRSSVRVRRNEWKAIPRPEGEPHLTVTVVIPAWNAGPLLPYVLAALSAQDYPQHLLDVVVVNDGPEPLTLPPLRPERTQIIDVAEGWGRANACHVGALASQADVLHWLDHDMVPEAGQVSAHMRWHHAIDDAVVMGAKWFVDPAPMLAASPDDVRDAVASGEVERRFFDGVEATPHEWTEEIYARTDDLNTAGWFALRTHVGASGSVRRDLYFASGGMQRDLRLGEDIALGATLGHHGAVFVPARDAVSWHLGTSQVMRRAERVNAYNSPFLADASPVLRGQRTPGRTYARPYVEVVLDARGHRSDEVIGVANAVLASTLHDVALTLVGEWSLLTDERTNVLDDGHTDLRVVHASYRHDPRVRLVEPGEVPEHSEAPFRVTLPGVAFAPRRRCLERLMLHLEHTHDGVRLVDLPDDTVVRVERTAAVLRARRYQRDGEPLDDVLAEVAGVGRVRAARAGFGPTSKVAPGRYPRTGGPPLSAEEAWQRIEKQLGDR